MGASYRNDGRFFIVEDNVFILWRFINRLSKNNPYKKRRGLAEFRIFAL